MFVRLVCALLYHNVSDGYILAREKWDEKKKKIITREKENWVKYEKKSEENKLQNFIFVRQTMQNDSQKRMRLNCEFEFFYYI